MISHPSHSDSPLRSQSEYHKIPRKFCPSNIVSSVTNGFLLTPFLTMDSRGRLSGRKYNFACLACRQRKVKCDGRKPTCKNCARSNSSCYYKNDSTAALHMAGELHTKEARIRELEDRVRELTAMETGAHDSRPASSSSQPQPQPDMPSLNTPTQATTTGPVALSALSMPVPPEAHTEPADQERYEGDNVIITNTDGKVSSRYFHHHCSRRDHVCAKWLCEQQYFGATSRFRGLSEHKEVLDGQTEKKETEVRATELYHQRWLSSNARFQPSWERTAYENIPRYTDVDPTICINLLEVYWAWQAPLHNCVYRRCRSPKNKLNCLSLLGLTKLLTCSVPLSCKVSSATWLLGGHTFPPFS